MTESLYQLDFISAAGSLRLLDIGDLIDRDIAPKVSQGMRSYAPIGAAWGECRADGGALVEIEWARVKDHASHGAARSYCMRHAAAIPSGVTGTLRMTISGGETWEISDAVITAVVPGPLVSSGSFETLTSYAARGGLMLPTSEIPLYAGIPWEWINQDWDEITELWESI